jgi:hypothetical protein
VQAQITERVLQSGRVVQASYYRAREVEPGRPCSVPGAAAWSVAVWRVPVAETALAAPVIAMPVRNFRRLTAA